MIGQYAVHTRSAILRDIIMILHVYNHEGKKHKKKVLAQLLQQSIKAIVISL